MKIGKYEVTIMDGDTEVTTLPNDLPVFDFEGNEVTLEEARAGNLRQSDYSRKTAEVASMKKLMDELGVPPDRGVNVMRHLLGVVAELEERGIVDPTTGEIIEGAGHVAGELTAEQIAAAAAQASPAVQKQLKEMQQRLGATERDMGALLSIISKRDIETAFPGLTGENLDWVFAMARDNQEKSPMEYAKALNDQLEARGQVAIDEHALKQEELKKQELARVSGKEGIEIFDEDVKFSYQAEGHEEGVKVVTPAEAAAQYMEAALSREE